MTRLNPEFLVVLCTHNGERHLLEQLESIASQSRRPRKIVVHDWASGDRTCLILNRFAERIKGSMELRLVEHGTAPGAQASFAAAINDCLENEKFDFLLPCDQDDVWLADKVESLEGFVMEQRSPDICFSDVMVVDEDVVTVRGSYYDRSSPFMPPTRIAHSSVLFANPVIGMTMCVSRPFLERVGPCLGAGWIMHDWGLLLLGVATGAQIQYLPRPLVKYRQHSANTLGATGRGRMIHRLGKVRSHVAKLRGQAEALATCSILPASPFGEVLATRGVLQRRAIVESVLGCPFLRRTERLQLAIALALCW